MALSKILVSLRRPEHFIKGSGEFRQMLLFLLSKTEKYLFRLFVLHPLIHLRLLNR